MKINSIEYGTTSTPHVNIILMDINEIISDNKFFFDQLKDAVSVLHFGSINRALADVSRYLFTATTIDIVTRSYEPDDVTGEYQFNITLKKFISYLKVSSEFIINAVIILNGMNEMKMLPMVEFNDRIMELEESSQKIANILMEIC